MSSIMLKPVSSPGPTTVEGSKRLSSVTDDSTQNILNSILKQLKIMNLHLSVLTDITINEQEVE